MLAADDARYDAICLWHSIEHLPRPWAVLREAAAHPRPGGILLVAAPNPLARQARLMRSHWPHWDLPRHLFALPIPWLQARAHESGLVTRFVTTNDSDSQYWSRFSWAMLGRRMLARRHLGWRLGMRFAGMVARWDDVEGEGAAYTVVFQKPAT